jgi:hypothetical protein
MFVELECESSEHWHIRKMMKARPSDMDSLEVHEVTELRSPIRTDDKQV